MTPILESLLASAIDYAGLYPPAGLSMEESVANYGRYRRSADAWALGRFIVGVGRLPEFGAALRAASGDPFGGPWRVAALIPAEETAGAAMIRAFDAEYVDVARVDTVEGKADSPDAAESVLRVLPRNLIRYVEMPLEATPPFLKVLDRHGAMAKVRTGGTVAELFPAPEQLLSFLVAQREAGVPYKATAGLHHRIRGRYPLTYGPDSPATTMFGFLNLFTASALLHANAGDGPAAAALVESDPDAFRVEGGSLRWRDRILGHADIQRVRTRGLRGFGSCSFREPIDELAHLVAA